MDKKVFQTVENGALAEIEETVNAALTAGEPPERILETMISALGQVGSRFQRQEIFVPEMLVSAMTMQRGVGVLKPRLSVCERAERGVFIIGTVHGDLHDIGKNLVAMMAGTAGFEVVDLGVDVKPERFVQALLEHPDCRVLGLSALLTTTKRAMGDTVEALERAGLRSRVKVLVGGTPVTEDFAREIGADAYTENAAAAAVKAVELAGEPAK